VVPAEQSRIILRGRKVRAVRKMKLEESLRSSTRGPCHSAIEHGKSLKSGWKKPERTERKERKRGVRLTELGRSRPKTKEKSITIVEGKKGPLSSSP